MLGPLPDPSPLRSSLSKEEVRFFFFFFSLLLPLFFCLVGCLLSQAGEKGEDNVCLIWLARFIVLFAFSLRLLFLIMWLELFLFWIWVKVVNY